MALVIGAPYQLYQPNHMLYIAWVPIIRRKPFFIPFDPALLGQQQLIRLKTVEVSVSPEAVNGNGGTGGGCHHTGTWFKRGGRSWPVSQPAALQQNADHDFHPFFLWRQSEFLCQSLRPFVSKICHSAMGIVCVRVTSY